MLNCGISGNCVTNLLARWKKDCINLHPDVISILIGVNDVWHELSQQEGVDAESFEEAYRVLLRYTKRMRLETKLILLGTYLTHGTATDGTQRDGFYKELALRNSITHRLAAEFGAEFLDLQIFDEACEMFPPEHWTQDGVHPTAVGHRLIANAWEKRCSQL